MIYDPLQLVGIFYAGIIAQAIFLVAGRVPYEELYGLPLSIGAALLGMFPGKHETNYDLYFHLLLSAGVFAVMFAYLFRKYLLDPINREMLLVWNLIFLYAVFRTHTHPYFADAAALIALALFANLFFPFDLRKHMQTAMYAYFLCLVAGTGILYLSLSNLAFFFNHGQGQLPEPIAIFFAGASLLYITVNLWYVYELNPIPGKHQTFASRMAEVHEDATLMEKAYDESFQPLTKELFIISAIGTLLAANFFTNFASDGVIIPLAVTFSHFGKKPLVVEAVPEQSTTTPTEATSDSISASPEQIAAIPQAAQTTKAPSLDT